MSEVLEFPKNAEAEHRALERALDSADGQVAALLIELESVCMELFKQEHIPALARVWQTRNGEEVSAFDLLTQIERRIANARYAVRRERIINSQGEYSA